MRRISEGPEFEQSKVQSSNLHLLESSLNQSVMQILNYINGEYVAPKAGKFMQNFAPATGEAWGQIPDSDASDVAAAVAAA